MASLKVLFLGHGTPCRIFNENILLSKIVQNQSGTFSTFVLTFPRLPPQFLQCSQLQFVISLQDLLIQVFVRISQCSHSCYHSGVIKIYPAIYPASAQRACALRALGLLLADSALTVGRGKDFWRVNRFFF